MKHPSLPKIIRLAALVLLVLPAALAAQTSPEAFLGHKVGADRVIADYGQIRAYFEKLDGESAKLQLLTIGETTLKKPMVMAVITSEENMSRLEELKSVVKKLRDPRITPPEEAAKLAADGKVILLITCSLHASEIAASQMSMELAYDLVTGKTPFDADKVLKDVIVLLVPSINPDGQQMECDWYRKYLGTKYEGSEMPWIYHHYAGHDNNRDWFMFNLAETRAVSKVLYQEWVPQIHLDEHQMGEDEARLFIPPFMNPPVPNVQPLVWRGVNIIGANMGFDLQKNGFKGVVHGRSFTGWWIGACDDTGWLHNMISLLSEAASVKLATPIYVEPTEIPLGYTQKRMEFPDPWPGGWWKLRDIVDYELTLSLSLVRTASLHREDLLLNSYRMSKNSIETTDKGQPYAFVIPARQHDYLTMLKMLDVLKMGGVEIHRAKADFVAGGRLYPAGSFVILLAQPYKPYAWALLERQKYPDLRDSPSAPPIPPYDNAGWTLPLQMGVACEAVAKPFETPLEKLETIPYPQAPEGQGRGAYVLLNSQLNASYAIAFALLKDKVEIFRTKSGIARKGFDFPAGSFVIKTGPGTQKRLPELLAKSSMTAVDIDDVSGIAMAPVRNPRIGLFQSWRGNMEEGWTRYVFDDLGIAYTTLHNADFKATKKAKLDLRSRFDVIVFPSEYFDIIKTGKLDPSSPWARYFPPNPPEYEGGIEKEGVDALKAFVEEGGIMVTANEACNLAVKDFGVPARNVLDKLDPSKFFCPTSILKIDVDNQSPIGYGLPEEAAAVFSGGVALETWVPMTGDWDRKVVASYAEDGVLMSGWLTGEDLIARRAAVVDAQYKKGRIIMIGVACPMRGQSHGTYKFLLNALLYPEK
jgi:hypothetical protein